jgi:hypothetical protein
MKKKFFLALSVAAVVSGVIFFACNKETAEDIKNETFSKKKAATANFVPDVPDEDVILANNIIVEFLLKSKDAYDKDPTICVPASLPCGPWFELCYAHLCCCLLLFVYGSRYIVVR